MNNSRKGRLIFDERYRRDIDSKDGKLNNLFSYLRENKSKYYLTFRNNNITLYSFGRGLKIERQSKRYKMSFEINNADELLKNDEKELDEIIKKLKDYCNERFDDSFYKNWKKERREYIIQDRKRKK